MPAARTCVRCGSPLPADALEGNCPVCLQQSAVGDADAATNVITAQVIAAPATRSHAPRSTHDVPSAPRFIGEYEFVEEIARGGMGVILRVRDPELSRTLAMKVMTGAPDSAQGTDPSTRLGLARFLEEAQVTAQLDHPGIVPVHEVGYDAQGQPFFTMKLVKGRDLNGIFKLARAEQEGWNLSRAVGVVVKACQALAYAHSKGVIHRDLKPSNIMVGRFGEVYVMDWGLAKVTGKKDLHDIRPDTHMMSASLHSPRQEAAESTPDSPLITMDGSVVGTPAYMPPEQAHGQVEEVDHASDIYSLGAILYNLLTGQAPYVEPGTRISPRTILGMVIQGPPKPVHQLSSAAPPELIAICEKAMAREKNERYASSADLAEDLQAFIDRRVVKAYRTGAAAELKSWLKRNRELAVMAGVAALLLFAAVAGFIVQQKRANLEQARANTRLRLHAYASDMKLVSVALQEKNRRHALELLRRYLPKPGAEDLRGLEWRYLWTLLRSDEHDTIPGHGGIREIAFSPDGNLLASAGYDLTVRIWEVETKKLLATLPGLGEGYSCQRTIGFSPDGRTFAVLGAGRVALWNTGTWQLGRQLEGGEASVVFSADGKWLATFAGAGVKFWDTTTWQTNFLEIGRRATNGTSLAISSDNRLLAVSFAGPSLQLWNLETRSKTYEMEINPWTIAFSPKGNQLAIGDSSGSGIVRVLDADSKRLTATNQVANDGIFGLAFSHDGTRVAVVGVDQHLRLFDVETLTNVITLKGHVNEIYAVAFSPDGRTLASGDKDGMLKIWSANPVAYTNAEVPVPVKLESWGEASVPSRSEWSGEASLPLRSYSTNGLVQFWNIADGRLAPAFTLPIDMSSSNSFLRSVLCSPDVSRAAYGTADGHVRLYDCANGKILKTLPVGVGRITVEAISPDNRFLVLSKGKDRRRTLWNVETGQAEVVLSDTDFSSFLFPTRDTFSPDGTLLAYAAKGYSVNVWDMAARKSPIHAQRSPVGALFFGLHTGRQIPGFVQR